MSLGGWSHYISLVSSHSSQGPNFIIGLFVIAFILLKRWESLASTPLVSHYLPVHSDQHQLLAPLLAQGEKEMPFRALFSPMSTALSPPTLQCSMGLVLPSSAWLVS